MAAPGTAAIVAVGSELALGELVDTNSAHLATLLSGAGISTVHHAVVGDDVQAIAAAVRHAASLASLVIVAGGLGPTADDLTRAGVALAASTTLESSVDARRSIEAFLAGVGRELGAADHPQLLVPAGADVIANSVGTAPGFSLESGDAQVVVLPGVPRELRHLASELLPRLAARHAGDRVVARRRFGVAGIRESKLGAMLAGIEDETIGLSWGTAARDGIIDVYLRASGERANVDSALETGTQQLRDRLGNLVFVEGDGELPEVVLRKLADAGQTLALAESCTGGRMASACTEIAGSSSVFLLGAVTYSNESKSALLGVPAELIATHGAVSAQVAAAMAEGAARVAGADWAISATGVAGPGGGTERSPVGMVFVATTWAGVPTGEATGEATEVREHRLPGDRATVQERAVCAGFLQLLARLRLER